MLVHKARTRPLLLLHPLLLSSAPPWALLLLFLAKLPASRVALAVTAVVAADTANNNHDG